jgi:molecular chaperone HscB
MRNSYFELLKLEQSYNIDRIKLKKQYLAMQVRFHPDRATDEKERRTFLETSMLLNEAEKILKDDFLRAEYMLKLNGVQFDDRILKDALTADELEEIMEIHEIIDEIKDPVRLKEIEKEKLEEKEIMVQELRSYFDQNNFAKAVDITIRLKYLTNLVKNIKLKIKHANSRDH